MYTNLLCRHSVKQGRWNTFKLTQLASDIQHNVSLRDAIGIWLNTANSTNPVRFREACFISHCNRLCPDEIVFMQDDSFLWEHVAEILTYCCVLTVTLICFAIKGIFNIWHMKLLHEQHQFLHEVNIAGTTNVTTYQVKD